MIWLNPTAFIGFAFVPLVIALHALRYRRREVQVSTLFLWESVAREAQGSLGWRRLIQNLPLIFQILLVTLLTLALANPAFTRDVAQNKDIVLVLDSSASMQARSAQGTRFAEAQQRALALVQELPTGRQMAIITAGRRPQVASFFTSEKALLRQAIRDLQASDAPGDMREALLLALSFTQGNRSQEVVLIGDGAYRQLENMDIPRGQLRHILIAGGTRNVGITRLALRPVLHSEERYEVLVAVKNFTSQPLEVPLQVGFPRRPLLAQTLSLEAGQEHVLVSTLDGPLRGVLQAELSVDDDFPLDNRAYGVVARSTQTWVLLVGEHNFFLETLLGSLPGVVVNAVPQIDAETFPRLLESNQLLIFNGVQPPPVQRGNFLLLNTAPQDARIIAAGTTVSQPRVIDWQRQHPLLQFVDLSGLQVEEAAVFSVQEGAQSLVDATGTALLHVIEEPPLRMVTLGFDLLRSDFPLRVAFPVFMSNLLRWVQPQQGDEASGQIQAGAPYPLFFETPVTQVEVQDPQGNTRSYTVQSNPWLFTETSHLGLYILRYGENKRYLAVNLLDDRESDINPADKLPALTPNVDEATVQAGTVHTPLWLAFLGGAVVVLLGEWYAWCRES